MRALRFYRDEAVRDQKFRCFYCKAPLQIRGATADHKHPQARKGRTTKENIAAACVSCNRIKGERFSEQFFTLIKKRKPPKNADPAILLVWAARRIWKRTHRACERIDRMAR